MITPPPPTPRLHWTPRALCLIIENRTCASCHSTQRVSSGLRLRLSANIGLYSRSRYELFPSQILPLLPREMLELEVRVEQCEHCFALSSQHQLCLWPELGQSHLTVAERINRVEARAHEALTPSAKLVSAFKDSDF